MPEQAFVERRFDCHTPMSPSATVRHATSPASTRRHRTAVVPGPRPVLRVLEGGAGPARIRRARYRRRRLAVAVLGVLVLLAARTTLGQPEGGSPATPGPVPAPSAPSPGTAARVVQPGDTLWTIARTLQPTGEVRPLVDRLVADRQGAPLRPGERIVLPGRT